MEDRKQAGNAPEASDQNTVRNAVKIERERANFKALVLKNPNYFGNMPDLGPSPVQVINQNRLYEELTCIGLHPEGRKLQAVVNIKRSSGYGGGTCTEGSIEYVRFFVRRATGWHDLGVASFTSHDLPAGGPLPVSYSVEMDMDEPRKYCTVENIVEVRGILSWNLEPPAGNPGWTPVWGNVLDVKVQVAPRRLLKVGTLLEDKLLQIDPSILSAIDLEATLQPPSQPTQPSYAALKAKYHDKDVPGHRFGFAEAQKLIAQPLSATQLSQVSAAPQKKGQQAVLGGVSSIFTDISSFLDDLLKTKGDTTYEELDCVGYNPETRTLSGVLTVKRNSGYSGDLCEPGSTEYVGFWAHYGGAWQSLGTAQVRVHDLEAVSAGDPIRYAVFRGANLPEHLCNDIQGIPLRAILSWNTPPTGPDFDPVWGNVVDTHIQPIITDEPLGDQRVRIMRINRVTVSKIDGGGLAQPSTIAGDCANGNNSPFGGPIYIEGDFTVKSDSYFHPVTGQVLPGQHPPAYQVFVRRVGSAAAPTQLTNEFDIAVFPANAPAADPSVTVTQQVQTYGGAEYYLYREGVSQVVNPRMLARWDAHGLDQGLYEIEVRSFVWNGAAYVPMSTPSQTQRVCLYNGYPHTELGVGGLPFTARRPEVELRITSHTECGDAQVGDVISGTYRVTDNFFDHLSIRLNPITVGGVPQPINPVVPSGPTLYPAAGTGGTSGTWTLDTAGMTPCGYTLALSAWDRALVGNSCHGHGNEVAVGFCLRGPKPKP